MTGMTLTHEQLVLGMAVAAQMKERDFADHSYLGSLLKQVTK